jgi:SAM-dependent methyltransferase
LFRTYLSNTSGLRIVEIGAQDVNGSLRTHSPPNNTYIGVDFVEGRGVDVVLTDPYKLPFDVESVDVIVCSSCLEHSEFFWVLFLEMARVVRPTGLIYLNVPSNGAFHRYPVDCWRFYPDSGVALVRWAKRNGYNPALLETFTGQQKGDIWNDVIAVFAKDEMHVSRHPRRMISSFHRFSNGIIYGSDEIINFMELPEDQRMSPVKRTWKNLMNLPARAAYRLKVQLQKD